MAPNDMQHTEQGTKTLLGTSKTLLGYSWDTTVTLVQVSFQKKNMFLRGGAEGMA